MALCLAAEKRAGRRWLVTLSPKVSEVAEALEAVSAARDAGQLLGAIEKLEAAVHRLRAAVNSAVMLGRPYKPF